MDERVCVLATGARTCVGATAPASAAAIRAGMALFAEHPFMIDRHGEPMIVARDSFLPPEMPLKMRLGNLASSAAGEALAVLECVEAARRPPLTLQVGLPEPRPGLPGDIEATLAERLQQTIGAAVALEGISFSRNGHSAGLLAIGSTAARIAAGAPGLFLAGGVDSYLEPETLEWLDQQGQLHGPQNTWGFVPGEAAAFCLLAGAATARRLGMEPRLWVASFGSAREQHRIKTDSLCVGLGLSDAVRQAAAGLPPGSRIDQALCDFNGEPYRGDELGYTIVRTAEHFVSPGDFVTPADCWGDVGAASGPASAMLAVMAGTRGYARGPLALACASSEGGARAALVIESAQGRHAQLTR
ncbi:MAG: hypothetical protein JSR59_15110 [Proteobacteria bacterium]|nr:hypothetical protein [Pseudomonadota bacterium]